MSVLSTPGTSMPSHFLVGEYMTRKEQTYTANWRCYLKTTDCIQHASEDVETDVQGAALTKHARHS